MGTNTKQTSVRCRIDPDVKQESKRVLSELGLTHSDVIRILLTRIAKEGKLRLLDTDKPSIDLILERKCLKAQW